MRKIVSLAIALMCNYTSIDAIILETDRLVFVQARSLDQLNENEEVYKLLPPEIDFESYTEIYLKLIKFFNTYESINEKDIFWGDYYIYLKKDASLIGLYSIYPPSLRDDYTKGYAPIFIYIKDNCKKNGYEDEILKTITHNIQDHIGIDYSCVLNTLMHDVVTNDNQDNIMNLYNKETGTLNGVFTKSKFNDYENLKTVLNCQFTPIKMEDASSSLDCYQYDIFSFFPPKKENSLSVLEIKKLEQLTWQLGNDPLLDSSDINGQEQLLSELKNQQLELAIELAALDREIHALKNSMCVDDEQKLVTLENKACDKAVEYENLQLLILESENTDFDDTILDKKEIKALLFN
ncbi:MAG: hypothetical protein Q8L85_09105 [Alphaproteobacteria bacterium]|nr:hypothetical protein [Alphaproteobacteria bacterium]